MTVGKNTHSTRTWAQVAGAAAVLAVTAGCGPSSAPPYTPAPHTPAPYTDRNVPAPVSDATGPTVDPDTPGRAFPQELVGEWNGSDGQGHNGVYLQFDEQGHFSLRNNRTGVTVAGAAAVSGSRIVFQTDGQAPYVETVQLNGGTLLLDGYSYYRTDAASGATAVVGSWISLDDYNITLTLTDGGQFQLVDPSKGRVLGTYTVSGSTLVVDSRANGIVRLPWSIADGTLAVGWPNGSVGHYVRAG